VKSKILVTSFIAISSLCAVSAAIAGPDNRPVISDGERALAMWQVQNLMSRHEYYHAAGMNLLEVKDLWVDENGPNASTAAFFSPAWVMQGIATVKKFYGEQHESDKIKTFQELQKVYPELAKMDPNTADIGGEFAMHTSTTPIIEVAGDGKTAKGIWYSPGMGLMPHVQGQSVQVGGVFFWEKYAGDFIKENGVWKIWHLGMYYDFTPELPGSMTASLGNGVKPPDQATSSGAPAPAPQSNREAGERMTPEQIAKGGMLPNPYQYPTWSPSRKNVITPRPPQPYYTFSETFSYGPYDANNQYNSPWNR